jgi:polysaccharide pyruvyl transferase WcaK-like protein
MNIIFSTTRQWNPGDEIILFGCINALQQAGLAFNPVIYNRNPHVRDKNKVPRFLTQLGRKNVHFRDNSLKDDIDLGFADMVVFAGTPEWRGRRLASLYRGILERKLPTLFLGIGTNRPFSFSREHFSDDEMAVLSQARLITCRDELTAKSLSPLPVHYIPCPALLSCREMPSLRTGVRRLGLIFGSDRAVRHNNVSADTFRYLDTLYRTLMDRYGKDWEIELVAHYIDELPHAVEAFPGIPLRYSYDARDYAEIYARYDLVVGHRVHGIGVAASQGIPGISVSHDARGDTTRGFGARIITPGTPVEEVCTLVEDIAKNINACSGELIAHKRTIADRYLALLKAALPDYSNDA